ncbi:hypothetical protein MP638_005110 [Amoeboaphelidium occidentale]|nr:hypothetical protein MP638_005110 [Amoeboaphelidium occidentale]
MSDSYVLQTAEKWTKFSATTVGRDKLYRLVQYFSKYLAFYLQASGTLEKSTIEKLTRLSSAVGLARKLFRVGKPIDFFQTIMKSVNIKDDVIRYCVVGRSTFLAGWLTLDIFQWLNAQKVIEIQDIKTINRTAAKCWLLGLICAVTADLYRLRNNLQRLESIEKGGFKALKEDEVLRKEHLMFKAEQPKLVMELLQDSLDVVIPAALLEYLPVSQGVVGLVGTITSLMGVYNAWPRS